MSKPDLICHYTSLEGFKSIIESSNIWATNLMFLNDSKEYLHTFEIFKSVFDDFKCELNNKSKISKYFVMGMERSMDGMGLIGAEQHYVTSFSENLDQLSQWRAYGSIGIIFDRHKLEDSIRANVLGNPTFDTCKYSKIDMQHEIKSKLTEIYTEYEKRFPIKGQVEIFELAVNFQIYLYDEAAFVKDNGFHEEAEIRLSYAVGGDESVNFRTAGSSLTPYIEMPFSLEAINSIIIGPNIDSARAENSLGLFLKAKIPKNTPYIRHSIVPYRSW